MQKHTFKYQGFTLAEVLITLGVIGVVAAVALPSLLTNIQERVQREQVRTAKYKLTLATDKMKSLGLLGVQYGTLDNHDSTEKFVQELKKHFKIAKVCDNQHLRECWPTDEINLTDGTDSIDTLTTGEKLKALALSTKNTRTVGIVTADGIPMIMVYSPNCTPLEAEKTYIWSTVDNKPETNTTTNCISAIMDINGKTKPNKIGKDVRTWNSLYGSKRFESSEYTFLAHNGSDQYECNKLKDKLGIKYCMTGNYNDWWGGAVKKCYEEGLHLPSPQTLAMALAATYGRSDITVDTGLYTVNGAKQAFGGNHGDKTCEEILKEYYTGSNYICVNDGKSWLTVDNTASVSMNGYFWSSNDISTTRAIMRGFLSIFSYWEHGWRGNTGTALCVGD